MLLFVVSAVGYLIGNIPIRGTKLGVSAVLFVGLGFGALDPGLQMPEVIIVLGLSMFVYTIGLSSGPTFFSTFKAQGLRNFLFILLALTLSTAITVGIYFWLNLNPATAAGLLAGASTNTASLAGTIGPHHAFTTGRTTGNAQQCGSSRLFALVSDGRFGGYARYQPH